MADQETPQIYLISPKTIELSRFSEDLAQILDSEAIACFRLALAADDADDIGRAADVLREVCHQRDVAITVNDHISLAERLGLDGVHLNDGPHRVRAARKTLGGDAIVGSYCGDSRHSGMSAGEAGADYVAFGPVGETGLDTSPLAAPELFGWWSQVIEIPIVAEGGLNTALVTQLAPFTDFFGIGPEIWRHDSPLAALRELTKAIG